MNDIFSISKPAGRSLSDYHLKRMVLSPDHWRNCSLPVTLNWQILQFTEANADHVPNNTKGIYSFLVQPGIAQHPSCSYLLYIGQTERQNFRERFRQYLRDWRAGSASRRVHITDMLEKWEGFLWFAYAPVQRDELIVPIEDALLSSYLPPANKDFPAAVAANLRRLFST